MLKKEYRSALSAMRKAGKEMMKERNGEFSFGEWAGESDREIIYIETGLDMDDLSEDESSELLDAFLGF